MVTIRDVTKHAGVSPATVSRVVNGWWATPTKPGNASRPQS
ncbi:DNA-binding LacI/PurR family transcriptional regulator [Arthrobacter ginsengisoli]|uniref:DNA-binding LacI/PurR family transcriptional regulator n=1 Tax=Arthrobacter ginsengisoli TaxID=1356565 RepID=A0ABU1UEH8_9MICC|nr:LacI family DNA-binding transcriptional regulator [Arthrobacter ginsengisoli]MDR7083596.1 DNA-binding LacI/PurR family transcriptional regulator [Arthrobacter ginsengisoli]